MKERMQKTLSQVNGCPQRDRSETEWYGGVQTFMWMCEDNIVEVPFDKEHRFEQILSLAFLCCFGLRLRSVRLSIRWECNLPLT